MSFRFPKVFGRSDSPLRAERKLSTKDKKFAAELMHQQCWCWGQDIVAKENILLRFGFMRHRAPACPGATRYEIDRDRLRVALWGFGMWLLTPSGDQGFFSRYRRGVWLLPRSFDVTGVHDDKQVTPHLRRPMPGSDYAIAVELTSSAAVFCEQYERWINDHLSPEHRHRTLSRWEHPLVDSHEMVAAWRRVRQIYQQWYRNGENDNAIGKILARLHDNRVTGDGGSILG
jgi:hypothetical protein